MATVDHSENGSTAPPESNPTHNANSNYAATDPTESALEVGPASGEGAAAITATKWPGWPGDCVFRLVVPVLKVGSIIGRKGELIKKMCEETRARIRVLDAPIGTPDRVVLISGKEEPEAPLSPAMDAALRVFKRVSGLSESVTTGASFCSFRLLVASTQAISLIGKQGSLIKSIQESTGASARILQGDELPFYAGEDERMVELQGEASKVLKALEAVVGHLRKFLVDHSVLPLFEKNYNALISQERQAENWSDKSVPHSVSQAGIGTDYPLSAKRDSLFFERETHTPSQISLVGRSAYEKDPVFSGLGSTGLARGGAPIVTQVAQTMQIPISYAEDIIGIGGSNIAYIRRTSGAVLTVQESMGLPDEITVEIKGTSSQVQLAQQLIQEFISGPKEPLPSSYGKTETGLRSLYPQLGSSSYSSSSLSAQPYGSYGSFGMGGYSNYRF